MDELNEFFAVTKDSAYKIENKRNINNCPIVRQIRAQRKDNVTPSRKLTGGSHVGIMMTGIVLFSSSKKHREPEFNAMRWGDKTSPVVALFLNKEDAMACFGLKDLQECDPLWEKETLETWKKIGKNHPIFISSILGKPLYRH